jgi:hypothetical protein
MKNKSEPQRKATKRDWENHPMPKKRVRLEVRRFYPAEDWDRISLGHIPGEMEDKWFIYADGMQLHFHRSWTGYEVFIAQFELEGENLRLAEAWVNRDSKQYESTDADEDREALYSLVDHLREDHEDDTFVPFCVPVPPNEKNTMSETIPQRFKRISYADLNSRQQESYNFQKVSALLADYGFTTIRLNDDWQGADFIAQHSEGEFLKVQLKGRLSFYKKYRDKDLYICFRSGDAWFLYPHDEILRQALEHHAFGATKSWTLEDGYSFPNVPKELMPLLMPYRIG